MKLIKHVLLKEQELKRIFILSGIGIRQNLQESVDEMVKRINEAQIVMFPEDFLRGDERMVLASLLLLYLEIKAGKCFRKLLYTRDGLVLGICNGFQALIKLGLVRPGEFKPLTSDAPTLTFNTIGRHLSQYVTTKVISVKSPWFATMKPGGST